MKKSIFTVLAFITLSISAFTGCNKTNNDIRHQPGTTQSQTKPIPYSAPNAAQIHNSVVNRLITIMGENSPPWNYRDNYTGITHVVQMAIDDGVLPNGTNVDSLVQILVAIEFDAGLIKADSTLATPEEIFDISKNVSTNVNIRAAFDDLHHYSGSMSDYPAYAQMRLQSIPGLSTQEQADMYNIGSILGGSYEIWKGKLNTEQQLAIVTDTDALIYQFWRHSLIEQGIPAQIAEPLAMMKSAKASYQAFLFVKDL